MDVRVIAAPRTFAFTALLAGGSAIGFAPILVRLSDVGPAASAFWRLALAAPLLWLWVGMKTRSARPARPEPSALIPLACVTGLFFAADLGVWHWSIRYTTIANATLLTNFAPVFVTIAAAYWFGQRVSSGFIVGLAIALGGAVLLAAPNFALFDTRALGDALALLTAVFYAGYLLSIKRARASTSTATLMALSTSISAAALLPVALLSPQPLWPSAVQGWLPLLALALLTQILGQGLIAYALAHLSATLSSVSLLIQPLVATALAWMLFGETLAWPQLLGAALVLTGIFFAKRDD